MAKCRFDHDDEAVARVTLTEGCLVYPDDREQLLCLQHLHSMTAMGDVVNVEWLVPFEEDLTDNP